MLSSSHVTFTFITVGLTRRYLVLVIIVAPTKWATIEVSVESVCVCVSVCLSVCLSPPFLSCRMTQELITLHHNRVGSIDGAY